MLSDAWGLFSDVSYRSAADRAYYAMFHAAHGALGHVGIEEPRTHRGLRSLFGKHLVIPGLIEREHARNLAAAQQMREEMTHELVASPSREEVKDLLTQARACIDSVRTITAREST